MQTATPAVGRRERASHRQPAAPVTGPSALSAAAISGRRQWGAGAGGGGGGARVIKAKWLYTCSHCT